MRKAFSLVEVLVVVSIISALMALLIPAVQAARESARAVSCHNNLKQLGVAFHLHEQSMGRLPGAGWGSSWTGDADLGAGSRQPGSWIFSLLPYMDHRNIHILASDGSPESITDEQKSKAADASKTPIDILICSSRRGQGKGPLAADNIWNMDYTESVSKTDYSVNAGDTVVLWGQGPDPASAASGSGFEDMTSSTGVAHQASQLKFDHIRDGLSNTYLAGEKRIDRLDETQDDQGALFGADVDTARWTEDAPGIDSNEPGANFGSAHPSSFGMLTCDGSVRSVSYEIDRETHSRLGNRKDGQVAQVP
jgi:prepilin-type N-terminal cleavage/methylation domain-containing protein